MKQKWSKESAAPRDAWPVVIAARITCDCGFGGIIVLSAARQNGEWITEPFEHSFEITHFMILEKPPTGGMN